MRKKTYLAPLALLVLLGCSSFDKENLSGSSLTGKYDDPRIDSTISRTLTDINARSIIDTLQWSGIDVCRSGLWADDSFFAFMQFHSPSVNGGVDSLNGRNATDENRKAFGIDSIRLELCLVNNSPATNTVISKGPIHLYSFKRDTGTPHLSLQSLGTFSFAQDLNAPKDTAQFSNTISDPSNLAYRYLVDSLFVRRSDSSLTIPLALFYNGNNTLVSLNASKTSKIWYYGFRIQRDSTPTPNGIPFIRDTLIRDSIAVPISVTKTIAFPKNKTQLDSLPSVTTYAVNRSLALSDTSKNGRFAASFNLSLDSAFSGFDRNSKNILTSTFTLYPSFGEDEGVSVDFLVRAQLLDNTDSLLKEVKFSSFWNRSTVAFDPSLDTLLTLQASTELTSALTNPLWSKAKTLRLILSAYKEAGRNNTDRMGKIIFQKKIGMTTTVERRY